MTPDHSPTNPDEDETIAIAGKRLSFNDYIRVLPSAPKKRDGFIGKVMGWWMDGDVVTAIDVWGARTSGRERMRSLRPERCVVLSEKEQAKLQRAANKSEVDE